MEIVNIQPTENPTSTYQQYDSKDLSLIASATISNPFGEPEDYVEYFIYDLNDNLLTSDYYTTNYKPGNVDPTTGTYTSIQIDPESDVRLQGYDRGAVKITYNFFRKLFKTSVTENFWIKEISGDRTEIRLSRQDLSNLELQQTFIDYDNQTAVKAYYPDFYLNFGENRLLIGVNVMYALKDEEGCLLIKLYEPLPDDLGVKDVLWIVDKLSNSATYEVNIEVPSEVSVQANSLRGPNYSVDLLEKVGQATPLYNYTDLFSTTVSSSYQQLRSLMEEKGLDINVDYTNFSNFVHFSSATERIYNFAYKVQLLENYNADIQSLGSVSANNNVITSGSKVVLQAKIDNLIEKFDGYEYYLYYTSGSDAWPKSGSDQPYTLYPITSSQVINWLGSIDTEPTPTTHSILYSASLYDTLNKDLLINTVPEYLTQDPANEPYTIFLNMIGQHFDNIWIYLKDVTERYDAENNLEKGISRDLVGDALKALGMKLYTNTNISDNIYYTKLGINPDGTLKPPVGADFIQYYIPFLANGLYVITDYVDPDYVDSFNAGKTVPGDDVTKEYYKRLYHNVPYLLKTRGTERGLRALINCFGIPDSILRIKEFGGSDKFYSTPDLIQTRHSLAYYNSGSTNLALPWMPLNYYSIKDNDATVMPDTIEFRFKTLGIPESSNISQSLFEVNRGNVTQFGLQLTYDPLFAVPSSSYENYGSLSLHMKTLSTTPIKLPFFDTEKWWSVMIKREVGDRQAQNDNTPNRYWVYVKSANYNEEGDAVLGFEASQSLYTSSSNINSAWNTYLNNTDANIFSAYLGGTDNGGTLSPNGTRFQGFFQEFRYWATPLSESIFDEHVVNSTSYRSNTPTGSLFDLAFRLPLGSNLNVPYLAATSMSRQGEDTLNSFSSLPRKDYDLYELGATPVASGSVLSSYHPAVTGSFYLPFNGQTVSGINSFVNGAITFSYGKFGTGNERYFQPFDVTDIIATPSTGISQAVNNKVEIFEKYDLEESTLSPYVSIQKPNLDLNRNSADLEVGFSPSDAIDLDITNQLGYFNIDEYIGNPADVYQDSYADLATLRRAYFQKYLRKYNVWDFIRLIKYYDNSLFKMMKDFVPARANLSTGIIVKPHILERPKYKRYDPIAEQTNNYSGSIYIGSITGSNPEDTYLNTAYTASIMTTSGSVSVVRNDLREAFTGDFSGSNIQVVSGEFPQIEYSTATGFGVTYVVQEVNGQEKLVPVYTAIATSTTYSIDPLQNNVSQSRKSNRFLSTDYSYNVNVPVNEGIIEIALQYFPWSPINDFVKYSNQSNIQVGDELLDGLVAHVLQPGDPGYDSNYLAGFVVSTDGSGIPTAIADNTQWGDGDAVSNASGTALLDGKPNTLAIYLGPDTGTDAAKVTRQYRRALGDANWYLPDTSELTKIYNNFSPAREARNYWTSTETNISQAKIMAFNTGTITDAVKSTLAKVFAIKYFSFGPPPTTTYWPFAQISDYNYVTYARTNPRYEGSRLSSLLYNTYTPETKIWGGDISYGKTAVIDKIKLKYAYIVNIYTPTNQMIGRSNAQIKYLIDNDENTLSLTKVNNNIFDIQNIYKSGETVQIALFDYEPSNPDVQTLTNNKTVKLYEGGFRYSPVLVRVDPNSPLNYTYVTPYFSSSQVSAPTSAQIYPPQANSWASIAPGRVPAGHVSTYPYIIQRDASNNLIFPITCSIVYNQSGVAISGSGQYTTTNPVTITLTLDPQNSTAPNTTISFTIPSGSTTVPYTTLVTIPGISKWFPGEYYSLLVVVDDNPSIIQYQTTTGGTTTLTNYYVSASDYYPDWYAIDTQTIRMSVTQSLDTVYSLAVQTYSGSKAEPGPFMPPDPEIPSQAGIETPVFPIELNLNDIVKFFSPTSQTWAEEEEYRVVSTTLVESGSTGIYHRHITLDRQLNPAITENGTIPGPIAKYLALKNLPDETNLILRYSPRAEVTQNGLIYPQYINPVVRDNSGNVIQSLRANNLIDN